MKKQLIILVLALIATVGFYSCDKKYQVIPPPTPFSSLRDSFEFKYNQNRQNTSFNPIAGGQYVTEEGIRFDIPPYAFKSANGDTILGTVDMEIIEILTPNDVIFNTKSTTSDGEVLITGGQFKATFTSNGSPVYVSGDTVIQVEIPTLISDPNMNVYDGTEDATGFINWKPNLDTSGFIQGTTITQQTLQTGIIQDYYLLTIDSVSSEWVGCEYLYDVPGTRTGLTVNLPEMHDNANTMFFIHFNNFQSVMGGHFNGNRFVSNGVIPVGTSIELIFLSEIDGNYKSKFIPITVSNGYTNTITLDPTTYEDIVEDITNL